MNGNKSAIISGASRGIGEAISIELARRGWSLGLIARRQEDLERVVGSINSQFDVQIAIKPLDICSATDVNAALEEFQKELPPIELIVCNAGIGVFKEATETTEDDWIRQLDTNAKGSFFLAKIGARIMKPRGKGQIIFIASDAARRTFAQGAAYCASKFAQYGFASALRHEMSPHGIRVSIVMPGLVASYFNDGKPDSAEKDSWLKPEDIADLVGYIAGLPPHVIMDEVTLHPLSQEY